MTPIRYLLEDSGWVGNWPRVVLERWKNKNGGFTWVIQVDTGIFLDGETLLFKVAEGKMKCGFSKREW